MVRPFSIQAPQQVAEAYGGNKQKIMQAAQMGIVDPTAAVLAGMFIDRMRSAQVQEAGNKPTIAQQVMGGAPPAPSAPQSSLPPSGGLGATPQAAPPMAPEMPQGMADGGSVYAAPYTQGGGLSDAPIPDTMFDEPSNGGFGDGYAGGGLVAFGDGGPVTYEDFARVIPEQESAGSGDYKAHNRQSGALGRYQLMPATAQALARRLGKAYDPRMLVSDSPEARAYQDALGQAAMQEAWKYGKGDAGLAALYYHGGPNQRKWGQNTQQYRDDILSRLGKPKLEEQDIQTAEGRRRSLEQDIGTAKGLFADLPDAGLDEAKAYYRKQLDPAEREKDRKQDMWMALAQIGAGMASSNSPYFLQAAGEAMAAALPGISASQKERKAAERDAINAIMEISGQTRKQAREVLEYGKDIHELGVRSEEAETGRTFQASESAKERAWRSNEAEKARVADIALAKLKQNPSDMESALVILQNGSPQQRAALEAYFQMKQKYAPSAAQSFNFPGAPAAGGQGTGDGVVNLGNM